MLYSNNDIYGIKSLFSQNDYNIGVFFRFQNVFKNIGMMLDFIPTIMKIMHYIQIHPFFVESDFKTKNFLA